MNTYEIAFSGQMVAGADPLQVRQAVQRLFNASEQMLEQLFSGRRVVVKRGLDRAAAEKYRQAFARAGALVEVASDAVITPETEQQVAATTSTGGPASADAATETGEGLPTLEVAPRDEYMAAFSHVQAPDFGLAATGEDLQQSKPAVAAVEVDVSGIGLAPVGSDLGQLPGAEPVSVPDTSHLQVQELDDEA